MATAKFYVPTMSLGDTIFGALDTAEVLSYSSTEIRLGVPGGVTLAVVYGQFQFDPYGDLTGGTLTGLTTYLSDGVSPEAVLRGMNVDILTLVEIALNGSEDDLGNLMFGGADQFTGSSGADELPTFGGNDTIDGGAGSDTMEGGNGSDTYFVRDVGDLVIETNFSASSGGTDTAQSYLSSYTLPTNVENGRIMTSGGAKLVGNGLANAISGGNGADTLAGGAGNDKLAGGSGNDTADYASAPSAVKVNLSLTAAQNTGGAGADTLSSIERLSGSRFADQFIGNAANNSLVGGDGNDSLYGMDGVDTLNGGNGSDSLDGGNGGDSLTGGAGNDRYVVQNSADKVVEAGGGGSDSVSSSTAYTLPVNVEQLTLTGSSAINGSGNGSNNTITGNSGVNSLNGGDGNDSLYGKDGVDTLIGGNGNDLLDGGNGGDSLTGGAGNDRYVVQNSADKVVEASGGGSDSVSSSTAYTLPVNVEQLTLTGSSAINGNGNGSNNTITGNSGVNSLNGGDGNDSLYGKDGVDTLIGGNGNDLLDGGNGGDRMTGGAGNDRYVVQNIADLIVEASGGGSDSVSSSIDHTLADELEKLTLTGSSALEGHGNSLNNTIVGNSGANLLRGSIGNDTLTGGAGSDVFRFSSALNASTNVDRVTDFSLTDDVLQLENSIFTKLTTTGVLSASNFRASSTGNAADGNDYVLYETDTGKLFYDADGSGTGAKVLVATLSNLPVLSSDDIFVS
jgi:trimeric autotransporter adhesin